MAEEKDAAYDSLKAKQEASGKAKQMLCRGGYARGGGVSAPKAKKIADKEIHKHEKHDHKGEKETKLKQGGKVEGKKAKPRADKFARGGATKRGHTKVNINIGAGDEEKKAAMQQGMQVGAQMAMSKMAAAGGRPMGGAPMQARPPAPAPQAPMPGGAPGGMPPGAGGVPPTMGHKRGGRAFAKGGKVGPVRVEGTTHLKGGAGGGEGRLDKIKQYGGKKG